MACLCCKSPDHCYCSFHTTEWRGRQPCGGCMKHQVSKVRVETPVGDGKTLVEDVTEHVCR